MDYEKLKSRFISWLMTPPNRELHNIQPTNVPNDNLLPDELVQSKEHQKPLEPRKMKMMSEQHITAVLTGQVCNDHCSRFMNYEEFFQIDYQIERKNKNHLWMIWLGLFLLCSKLNQ